MTWSTLWFGKHEGKTLPQAAARPWHQRSPTGETIGLTVSEVKGFGNEQTRPESFMFIPKTKIEIYCTDEDVDDIIAVISRVCQTGQLGDGKIAVSEVQDLIRIRTGERGEVAV